MKFGVRECCEVVLKAKATQKVGNKIFYANEPVIYFDTLKTSSMEGAATTVYATGGRGNSRLMAWEGERTVTFTMEDALISPEGFMILSGAGLVESTSATPVYQHVTERIDASGVKAEADQLTIRVSKKPYLPQEGEIEGNYAYVMLVKDGEIVSEPYIPEHVEDIATAPEMKTDEITGEVYYEIVVKEHAKYDKATDEAQYQPDKAWVTAGSFDSVIVDYYVRHEDGSAVQIDITPDKFGGNYYLEASTLWRNEAGIDMPAEFIIPNCKIQSNFTFTMASSGDPSTFTFTMDAFPDYTRFNHSKKVLAAIQVIKEASALDLYRGETVHEAAHDKYFS